MCDRQQDRQEEEEEEQEQEEHKDNFLKNQTKNVSQITKGMRTTLHLATCYSFPAKFFSTEKELTMSPSRNSCVNTHEASSEAKGNEACNPSAGRCCRRFFGETCSDPRDFHAVLFKFGKY
jgi:hypothetical protein